MSEIVVNHFASVDEPDLFFDGISKYTIKNDVDDEDYKHSYDNLTETEFKRGQHINYYTFRKLFELMRDVENPTIIETGTSTWSVTASSKLFDTYINKYGGEFHTVDMQPYTHNRASQTLSTMSKAYCGDSVQFIKNFEKKIDVAYLDSYDIEWLNYEASAQHGKKEMEALLPKLNNKSLVLIDDTPSKPVYLPWRNDTYETVKDLYSITDIMPGKGMYAEEVLLSNKDTFKYTKLIHQYQVLFFIERL